MTFKNLALCCGAVMGAIAALMLANLMIERVAGALPKVLP